MSTRFGFTGTRRGMTKAQRTSVDALLSITGIARLHHGGARGADKQAHELALLHAIEIHIHPSDDTKQHAKCLGAARTYAMHEALERNKHIVESCDVLIAAPGTKREHTRSGTWATVRCARKVRRQVIVVYPDGTMESSAADTEKRKEWFDA